ncbi:MAG: PAS domain-containing protein [Deltaproteobacteria bacterium]|jgi:signal transduction histidine kinase|nr:PAS domain-containing protein [Deltaproteobacteria bacterium]
MNQNNRSKNKSLVKSTSLSNEFGQTINVAIVGGGRACKYFLDLLSSESFTYLKINIVGVCDINPEAEGLALAKEMGIYTTNNFQDLFKIKNLDSIIELTGKEDVLLEIIRLRPIDVGVIEHNIGRLMRKLFEVDQRLSETETQLVFEKNFSDFLIQQSTAAIVILNTDFEIVETNDPYLKAVNKSKEEVIGRYCYEISHGYSVPCSSSRPDMKCPLVETLRNGKSAHVIHEHPEPGGHFKFCNLVTYPLRNQNGEIYRIIEVWRDITDQLSYRWDKQVKELKSNLQKLVQEDRMISLGKLVASCVHEINNPIQGLLTFSHLMQEILTEGQPSSEDLKQFKSHLSFMSKELERCGNIVSGLLSFSRETPKEFKKIDINDVLNTVITLTRHKMELRNVQLIVRLYPGFLMIQGDERELQQCFLNLIFNAIEAMPKGGQLQINSKLDDKKIIRIEIQDTGYGIPKENLGHIFDPFYTTKAEGEGTGLGLSIVYGITKNHKGNIKVNSKVGEGSSFVLTFPVL